MAVILDFFVLTGCRDMKKRSEKSAKNSGAGRPISATMRLDCQKWGTSFQHFTAEEIHSYLHVGRQTVYRWIADQYIPDRDKARLLSVLALGEMPWSGWEDWRVCVITGRLLAPNGLTFARGELEWLSLLKEQFRQAQLDNTRLLVENAELRAALEERHPLPALPFPLYSHFAKNDH